MHTFYILVVSLIVFEALVIQSDAVETEKKGLCVDDVKLPPEVLARIFHKSGFKATGRAARSLALLSGAIDGMIEIFQQDLLVIDDETTGKRSTANHEGKEASRVPINKPGRVFCYFENYNELTSLFNRFGEHARRICLGYDNMDATIRRDINKNIVNKYANQFTELYISAGVKGSGIWQEMSNKNGLIQFPNVRKFFYSAKCANRFNLNAIFPKLESVTLEGFIGDHNCLAHVKNLKELRLFYSSIQDSQFKEIIEKNRKITRLSVIIQEIETLQFIEEYLTKLQTLKIGYAGNEDLNGSNRVYNLKSVTSFGVVINGTSELSRFISLEMPKLERLKITGGDIDKKMFEFINHFGNFDTVQLLPDTFSHGLKYLGKLKNVKHVDINPFDCDDMLLLEDFFKTFDKTKSKLNSLKFKCLRIEKPDKLEEKMNKINDQLMKLKKPTWTAEEDVENYRIYLIIKRNP